MERFRGRGLKETLDWPLIICYLLLVFIGWINIYASVQSAEPSSIFDFATRSGKQFIWMVTAFSLAGLILFVISPQIYESFSLPIYLATVALLVAVIFLTSFIAVALDVVLPDVLAQLTSSTLFYEDLNNQSLASEQAEFNASLDRKFIMLNLLNGNYDPQYEYETLKADSSVSTRAKELGFNIRRVASTQEYENMYLADELFAELYQFIYDEYVMTDMDYALLAPNVQFEDGSYLRLQNLSLGYTFPDRWTRKAGISKLRLYIQGTNLFTWTKYTGYNPEVNNHASDALRPGEDYCSYPLSRTFSVGVNFNL